VILKFNNKLVNEMRNLPKIVAETDINIKVDVEVWRDRRKMIMQVSVGELDEREAIEKSKDPVRKLTKEKKLKIKTLGISISSLSVDNRERFSLKSNSKGVVIVSVEKGGLSEEKGIKVGDVIVEVSQVEVSRPNDVKKQIDKAKKLGRKSVLFLIEGQGGLRFVALRLTKK
jgi:serine protease Do